MTTLQLRTALCERGYAGAVIPCDGKAPTIAGWQGQVANDAYSMARWRGLNTGLKTALNPVVDIDIMDPEAADLVELTAKDYFDGRGIIPTRFGKAPKRALIFRAAEPFPKMVADIRERPRRAPQDRDPRRRAAAHRRRRAPGHGRALHLSRRAAMGHRARRARRGYCGRDAGAPRATSATCSRPSSDGRRHAVGDGAAPGTTARRHRGGERPPVDVDELLAGAAPGDVNERTLKATGSLIRHGLSVEETVRTVLEALRRAIPGGLRERLGSAAARDRGPMLSPHQKGARAI